MNEIEKRIANLSDEKVTIKILNTFNIENGKVYIYDFETGEAAAIIYNDGTLFQQYDWQSGHPENVDEIENFDWVAEDNRPAIMFNGLPKIL